MFDRRQILLSGNVATGGTFKVGQADRLALATNGHVIYANHVRYASPTDFTIAFDVRDQCIVTWLHATTLLSGWTILVGVAMVDSITNSQGVGGSGTSDATAANQVLQTTQLGLIRGDLDTMLADTSAMPTQEDATNAYVNGVVCPIKRKFFTATVADGSNVGIAKVASKYLMVFGIAMMGNATCNVKFEEETSATQLSEMFYLDAAGRGSNPGYNPKGWFTTAVVNKDLRVNLSTVGPVSGMLTYAEWA